MTKINVITAQMDRVVTEVREGEGRGECVYERGSVYMCVRGMVCMCEYLCV